MSKSNTYDAIFFSPHLDDAVLSCSGLIHPLIHKGKKALVVTVFTRQQYKILSPGARDFLSQTKNSSFRNRLTEDKKALKYLGVDFLHLKYIEAGFRLTGKKPQQLIYQNFNNITHLRFHIPEPELENQISADITNIIKTKLKPTGKIFFPLGLGHHIDHIMLRRIAMKINYTHTFFWEDYPYLMYLKPQTQLLNLSPIFKPALIIDVSGHIDVKKQAIRKYVSQFHHLFTHKQFYVSSRETYYKLSKKPQSYKPPIMFLTDEIEGGAKIANDQLISELVKLTPPSTIRIFEQIPPNFTNPLLGTKTIIWSISNYLFLLRRLPPRSTIITTSSHAIIASKILKKLNLIPMQKTLIYFCHGDRSYTSSLIKLQKVGIKYLYHKIFIKLYKFLELFSISEVTSIITFSNVFKNYLHKKYGSKFPANKIHTIPSGVNTTIFYPITPRQKKILRAKYNLPQSAQIILYSGRIDPLKGIDKLITSLSYLDTKEQIICLILSSQPDQRTSHYFNLLKNLSYKTENKSTSIKFFHPETRLEISQIYQLSDCLVLPSVVENMPLVILEAMACGIPVIYCRTENMPILFDQDTKLICQNNPESIAKSLNYLINLTQTQRKISSLRNLKLIKHYNWSNAAKIFSKLIN